MKIAFEIEIDRQREQLSIWERMNILSSDSNYDSVQRDRFDFRIEFCFFRFLQKKNYKKNYSFSPIFLYF